MAPEQFSVFKSYKSKLLKQRGLQRSDGRSLYEYRLSTEEFDDLEDVLRTWLGRIVGIYDLGDVVLNLKGFPALFVLFAADWWRRRYDGSGFSWEPILRDLGVDQDSWTPGERSQCVKEGLSAWGLEPKRSGALRFLAAIAIQGGLPLRLLGEARGGVGRLLYRVLQLAEGRQISEVEVYGWVESLRNTLPKSYRQEIIYTLLSEMVIVVLRLKQEADLSAGDDAVAKLNRKIPDWKHRFPLSLDDQHAKSLVEQLVKDAASVQIRKIKHSLPVERFLEQDDEGLWCLVSRIELPDILDEQALARLFGLGIANLPIMATLRLLAGDRTVQTGIRKLAGRNSFRLEAAEWRFEGETACEEHLLQLSAADGRTWLAEAHRGESLDRNLLWIFAEDSPNGLLKQGGSRVAPARVLLALPEGWQLQNSNEAELTLFGCLQMPSRELFQVQGKARLLEPGGGASVVHTGQATATEQQLVWSGDRLWLDFISPRQAYKGMPQLYRVDDEGGRQRINGRPACSVLGSANNYQSLGPVILRYPANGDRQIQSRMLLLPKEAKVELQAADAKSGRIHFAHWSLSSVALLDAPSVKQNIQRENDVLTLQVAVGEDIRTPEWLQLEIHWPHTTHPVRMRLPYPAAGARVFDGANRERHSGAQFSVQDLLGVRLMVNLAGSMTRKTELKITSGHLTRSHPLRSVPGALKLEVTLVDYLIDIQHLLSMDDSPDSIVTVSLWSSNQSLFDLKIARYAAVMERESDRVYIETRGMGSLDTESIEKCRVHAARLEYPADEPINLEPLLSEGVPTGSWRFTPENKEPGTWLIYPAPENEVLFRACIWPVAGELESEDSIIQAMSIKKQVLRENSIQQTITMMAGDYFHPSWQIVEQLASQYGHLPLATLDLWRMFAHSFEGMAALAFRISDLPKDFYLRFAREMPFTWEIVPLKSWRKGIWKLKQQCLNQYGDIGARVFHSHLEFRIQSLGAECGALHYLLGIASANFDKDASRMLELLQGHVAPQAIADLFEGANSKLMALRRYHAGDDWPTDFIPLLDRARSDPDIRPYLYAKSYDDQDGAINVPLLTAAAVIHDKTREYFSRPENVHLLRTFRAFDMDWFNEAYNLTIARCLAEGVSDG